VSALATAGLTPATLLAPPHVFHVFEKALVDPLLVGPFIPTPQVWPTIVAVT